MVLGCGNADCGTFLDDPIGGDTDNLPEPHDGVYVGCQNLPAGGGADETGGGDAADAVGLNFWWAQYHGPPLPGWQACGPGVTDEVCCVQGQLDVVTCFQREYAEPLSYIYDGGIGPTCVTPSYDGGVDPLNDWVDGEYPTIDPALRSECSAQCENKLSPNGVPYQCDSQAWIRARTYNGWDPSDGYNCMGTRRLNVDDPNGGNIDWLAIGGVTAPPPLSCALDADCADWFFPSVDEFVLDVTEAAIIEPETRTAHVLGVDASGSRLDVDMPGTGPGSKATGPLHGTAEYTALDCGESVCPFYLGNLSAFNTTDIWSLNLDASFGSLAKEVSKIQIDLVQSTLGVHNVALNTVAFAPGALRLRVQIHVDSCEACLGFGNGTHVAVVENEDYVFADYNDGWLKVDHTFQMQSGSARLHLAIDPVEGPPLASHDLAATEPCDVAGGLTLDDSRSLASDPDDDIAFETWWVDGTPCPHGCVVPKGSHEISLEVHDSRGAVARSTDRSVFVDTSPACKP